MSRPSLVPVRSDPEGRGPGRRPEPETGRVQRVGGPVVVATGLSRVRLFDVVRVGPDRLAGEVIRLDGERAVIQVYEDTTGLRVGDPVTGTGAGLQVELGPGLLGSIVDGVQRPLVLLAGPGAASGEPEPFLPGGADPPRLDRDRLWEFTPAVAVGDRVGPGDLLGTVPETAALEHRVLVPPDRAGTVTAVHAGRCRLDDPVVELDGQPLTLVQRWPIRTPRPVAERLPLTVPLVTGQRVLDMLFPVARGGSAAIPGGFGTGKTVLEQALAKFAAADVVVYIGCGERGNELTEVLEEFPRLVDPRTGGPLIERTVLIANTSNMPVAAREASIYAGITIAEYYRDQGRDVAVMADSTSRWGEALREVSSRLEEVPAEEGYPAYLATRLAGFYERAGAARCLGLTDRTGSVTVVGAVSPAGGDLSEPITQYSLRLTGTFWSLDTALARSRHFPSVNWSRSYSLYDLDDWFDAEVSPGWSPLRAWARELLQQEGALMDVVALLGMESLAAPQRVTMRTGRLLREDFLQQSSFDPVDASCPPAKQYAMLRVIRAAHRAMLAAVERGVPVATVTAAPAVNRVARARAWPAEGADRAADALIGLIEEEVGAL